MVKNGLSCQIASIEKQSTRVDAVSGAPMGSVAILNAVEDAIHKAQ